MSETAPESVAPDAPAQEQPKPEVEIDWKAKAREWEKRAKENKSAAEKLAEIEEANKTEAQKAAERLAAAEKDAAAARAEALRFRIASKFSIGDEDADLFLTGTDEETLTRQAERLSARESERKKQGNHVPREGNPPSTGPSDLREFREALFDQAG
jgi:thioesterase domain-containing protein